MHGLGILQKSLSPMQPKPTTTISTLSYPNGYLTPNPYTDVKFISGLCCPGPRPHTPPDQASHHATKRGILEHRDFSASPTPQQLRALESHSPLYIPNLNLFFVAVWGLGNPSLVSPWQPPQKALRGQDGLVRSLQRELLPLRLAGARQTACLTASTALGFRVPWFGDVRVRVSSWASNL